MMDDPTVLAKQREFTRKITERFIGTQKVDAFKVFFNNQIGKHNPGVKVIWLARHVGPIRKLREVYKPQELVALVKEFAGQNKYHANGITFDSFYALHSLVAANLQKTADTRNKKAQMAKTLEERDRADLGEESPEMKNFKQSNFFKRLPDKWRQKLG